MLTHRHSRIRTLIILGCVFTAVLGMLLVARGAGAAAAGVDIAAVEGQAFTGQSSAG